MKSPNALKSLQGVLVASSTSKYLPETPSKVVTEWSEQAVHEGIELRSQSRKGDRSSGLYADIHGHQRTNPCDFFSGTIMRFCLKCLDNLINCNDFSEPLNVHIAPSSGQHFS